MTTNKKASKSFAAAKAKKTNPSEEGAEALLKIWNSPFERKRLYFNSGFNQDNEMSPESYRQWAAQPETREALAVTMDSSFETRFGFGIFSSGHGTKNQEHFYLYSHNGKAIVAGPDTISKGLQDKLDASGIQYVARTDKADTTQKINDFLAEGMKHNYANGKYRFTAASTVEILIHSFCGCEDVPASLRDGDFLPRGVTVGSIIAAAGNPDNVMCTVDLDKPRTPMENKMLYGDEPAAAVLTATLQARKAGGPAAR
jgi:hypothetical protein